MNTREERQWEVMRRMIGAAASGADTAPYVSQRTLFGIKSTVEEQIEYIVAADEAIHRYLAAERRAVIFDLDGTLLDTLPDLVNVTNRALKDQGFPGHTTEEIKGYVGNGLKALLRRAAEGADEGRIDALFKRWQELSAAMGTQHTRPYSGIEDALAHLTQAGFSLGVVSNKVDTTTQQVIDCFLPGIFAAVHGESEEYPRKPDPTGLLKTISELGVAPAGTAYVGDSPGDVRTAHAAGCLAVAVTWGYRPEEELRDAHPHLLIRQPLDLVSTLDPSASRLA